MPRRSLLDPPTRRNGRQSDTSVERQAALQMCMWAQAVSSDDTSRARAAFDLLNPPGGVKRTGVGYIGGLGGFAIKPEYATSVWDKARATDGPFARIRWAKTRFREFVLPIFNESSRANGSRWGGVVSQIGIGETVSMTPNASTPALGTNNYNMRRMTVFSTPISRDLLADSELILPMLDYVAKSEIRWLVDAALVGLANNQTNSGVAVGMPEGVMNSQCTTQVIRANPGAIGSVDIDKMWAGIAGPNKRNACWHCSDEVFTTIDETAQSGGWAESIYLPQGKGGNEFALLKGRPLIPLEQCSALGNNGDLICADWSDYLMVVHEVQGSSLAFNVTQPNDSAHQGAWGLPENTVEARSSDQFLFANDEVVFLWKARMDGHWQWTQPVKNVNGALVGPACMLI